jgi:VanZ family protein
MPYHLATPASGLYSTPMVADGQAAHSLQTAVQQGTIPSMLSLLNKIPRWIPAIVMMTAIFSFSSIPGSGMPSFGLVDLLIKKGGHAIGYALLALAFLHWHKPLWDVDLPPLKTLAWVWALTILYAASDEFHQTFVPGRGPSLIDILIDALGAFFGLLAYFLRQHLAK